jgi:hypothetical protein
MRRTVVHLQNNDPVDLPGGLYGVGNMLAFDDQILRGWGRLGFDKEAPALLQGAFRCSSEMSYIKTGIGPDGSRREGPSVRISKKDQRGSDTFKQRALKREPTLAEGFGGCSLGELAPEVLIEVRTLTVPCFAYFKTGARSISEV